MKRYKVDFAEIIPTEHFARKEEVFICAESFQDILEMLLPHQYILHIWEQQDDRYGSYALLNIPKNKKKEEIQWNG